MTVACTIPAARVRAPSFFGSLVQACMLTRVIQAKL
jgi:hypothetical protein